MGSLGADTSQSGGKESKRRAVGSWGEGGETATQGKCKDAFHPFAMFHPNSLNVAASGDKFNIKLYPGAPGASVKTYSRADLKAPLRFKQSCSLGLAETSCVTKLPIWDVCLPDGTGQ